MRLQLLRVLALAGDGFGAVYYDALLILCAETYACGFARHLSSALGSASRPAHVHRATASAWYVWLASGTRRGAPLGLGYTATCTSDRSPLMNAASGRSKVGQRTSLLVAQTHLVTRQGAACLASR